MRKETLSNCPICGSNNIDTFLKGWDFESNTGEYNIDLCKECKIYFTNPRPKEDDLHLLYELRNTPDFVRSNKILLKLREYSIKKELRNLSKKIKAKKKYEILDFGCGDGFFTNFIAKQIDAEIIIASDFHPDIPHSFKNNKEIKYIPYDELFANNSFIFDIIFCRHVLEHVPAPLEMLNYFTENLSPGGIIVLEVPNFNSVWRNIFKKYYYGLYLPRHLYHYNLDYLFNLLNKDYNLEIIKSHTPLIGRSLGYFFNNSLQNISIIGMLLYPIQIFFDFIFNSSSTIIVYARKL